jgi:ketosteroid isomerase-like protein
MSDLIRTGCRSPFMGGKSGTTLRLVAAAATDTLTSRATAGRVGPRSKPKTRKEERSEEKMNEDTQASAIQKCVASWHDHLRGKLEGGLDALLADDVVFLSPVVFTPQTGKEITKLYLQAAGATIGEGSAESARKDSGEKDQTKFRYIKEVLGGNHAMLEFETEMAGKYVNGVDILTCNDEGKIIEFKVMIRPLQAVNLLHQQMAAMLKKMQ